MEGSTWSFVAMEYYALILNRTFLVTVTDDELTAVVCRGLTSSSGNDPLARLLSTPIAVRGDLNDSRSYVDEHRLRRSNGANFSLKLTDVRNVRYDKRKKWGMGEYPHDGKVYVDNGDGEREFIILGNQSGEAIAARLGLAVLHARGPARQANPSIRR
jgi:hypothetical protein